MIKLLIFDLDGTLIDSAPDITTAVNTMLTKRDMAPLHGDIVKAAIGEGLKKLIRDLFPDHRDDPKFIDDLEADLMLHYDHHLLDTTKPFAGVEEFLHKTKIPFAIVTNKPMRYTEKTLTGLKLDQYPWLRVFSADSLPKRKPDPMPLIELMKIAGVAPEETLMIGDGIPDMLAAKAAGVRSVACEFGYTKLDTLKDLGAAATLPSYAHLPALIAELSGR